MHVTMRVVDGVNLRKRDLYRALNWSVAVCLKRRDFRVVHVSIQDDHVHLIVEAETTEALGCGMRGFAISAARQINSARGSSYVLNNWRKHREDRRRVAQAWRIDPFSSASNFTGWAEDQDSPVLWPTPPTYDRMMVSRPRSWLLRKGWLMHGLISICEIPSKR